MTLVRFRIIILELVAHRLRRGERRWLTEPLTLNNS